MKSLSPPPVSNRNQNCIKWDGEGTFLTLKWVFVELGLARESPLFRKRVNPAAETRAHVAATREIVWFTLFDLIQSDLTLVCSHRTSPRAPSSFVTFSSTEELELHKHLSLKLFFFVLQSVSSYSLCLCRRPTYRFTAAGTLYLDNAVKAYKEQNVTNKESMDLPYCIAAVTSDMVVMKDIFWRYFCCIQLFLIKLGRYFLNITPFSP